MTPQPTLTTPRLRLRPFTLADAPHVLALAGAREIGDTTLNIPHPYPPGGAKRGSPHTNQCGMQIVV